MNNPDGKRVAEQGQCPGMLSRLMELITSGGKSPAPSAAPPAKHDQVRSHPNMWWLTDVPMFIDERAVDRLYGAIVQPEYILLQSSETLETGSTDGTSEEVEAATNYPSQHS